MREIERKWFHLSVGNEWLRIGIFVCVYIIYIFIYIYIYIYFTTRRVLVPVAQGAVGKVSAARHILICSTAHPNPWGGKLRSES